MDIKSLLREEDAVSPVIAVILMVAITVVLAAVIGTFVLGTGEGVEPKVSPQTSFGFEFNESNTSVDVTHRGGDQIEVGENALRVRLTSTANASATWVDSSTTKQTISAGDTYENYDYGAPEATVRVVWEGKKNESSATLAQKEAPA